MFAFSCGLCTTIVANHITFDGMEYINCEDETALSIGIDLFSFECESCRLQEVEKICSFSRARAHTRTLQSVTVREPERATEEKSSHNKFQINKSFYTQLLWLGSSATQR